MWEKIWDYTKRVTILTRQTDDNTKDIKELRDGLKEVRQDIKEINQKLDRMTEILQKVAFEYQHDRANAETQREMQRLRLENLLYRFERRLPPGTTPDQEHSSRKYADIRHL